MRLRDSACTTWYADTRLSYVLVTDVRILSSSFRRLFLASSARLFASDTCRWRLKPVKTGMDTWRPTVIGFFVKSNGNWLFCASAA